MNICQRDFEDIKGISSLEVNIVHPNNEPPFGCKIKLSGQESFAKILKERERFRELIKRAGVIIFNFDDETFLSESNSFPANQNPEISLPWHIDKDYRKPNQSSIVSDRSDLWQQNPAILFNLEGSTRNAVTAFSKPKTLATAMIKLFELSPEEACQLGIITHSEIKTFATIKRLFQAEHTKYNKEISSNDYHIKISLILRDISIAYGHLEKVCSKLAEYIYEQIKNQILTLRWDTQLATLGQIAAFKQYDTSDPRNSILHTRINKPGQRIDGTIYHQYI